jgi:hypothetical protein
MIETRFADEVDDEPQAPVFGSRAPKISRLMRA